ERRFLDVPGGRLYHRDMRDLLPLYVRKLRGDEPVPFETDARLRDFNVRRLEELLENDRHQHCHADRSLKIWRKHNEEHHRRQPDQQLLARTQRLQVGIEFDDETGRAERDSARDSRRQVLFLRWTGVIEAVEKQCYTRCIAVVSSRLQDFREWRWQLR